jgi:hypothetical protein
MTGAKPAIGSLGLSFSNLKAASATRGSAKSLLAKVPRLMSLSLSPASLPTCTKSAPPASLVAASWAAAMSLKASCWMVRRSGTE